jgi:hypothetical protein
MNESASLERRYRRLLSWYPRSFRLEYEQEVLAVLMSGAHPQQHRPGVAESVDLLRSALGLRLRPSGTRPPGTVLTAVRLMLVGAVVEAVGWATYVSTARTVQSNVLHGEPGSWPAVVGHLSTVEVFAPIALAVWLWLAWASAAGLAWARAAFTWFFGVLSLALVFDIAENGTRYFAADTAATAALWLVALSATVTLYRPGSTAYYRPAG